jgi:hypothetical protein
MGDGQRKGWSKLRSEKDEPIKDSWCWRGKGEGVERAKEGGPYVL